MSATGAAPRRFLLGADIGGTKTLLGLQAADGSQIDRRYTNADFPDFPAVLDAFLAESAVDPATLAGGCLALAGPIADDGCSARLTNLPWLIDATALAARFGLPRLALANDFAAASIGAVAADAGQLAALQKGVPLDSAPRLVVGAGTGLGMAIVLPEDGGWRVISGEGGHVAFAPADAQQLELLSFLASHHGRVTWERVVSGPGLASIHEFLAGTPLPPDQVAARAAAGDAAAREAIALFLRAYGAYAGDMALTCLARGGVFLAGGIAAKLLPHLPGSDFLAAFNAKAEHADIAARMPVHVAIDPLLGLRGALRLAAAAQGNRGRA